MGLTCWSSLLTKLTGGVVCVKFCCSGLLWLTKALLIGRMYTRDPDTSYKVTNIFNLNFMNLKCLIIQVNRCRKLTAVLAAGAMNRAHANILRWWWFGQFKSLKRNMHTKCSTRLTRIRGSWVLLMEIMNAITQTRVTKYVFSLCTAVQLSILHLYNYWYALYSRSNKMAVPAGEPTIIRTF